MANLDNNIWGKAVNFGNFSNFFPGFEKHLTGKTECQDVIGSIIKEGGQYRLKRFAERLLTSQFENGAFIAKVVPPIKALTIKTLDSLQVQKFSNKDREEIRRLINLFDRILQGNEITFAPEQPKKVNVANVSVDDEDAIDVILRQEKEAQKQAIKPQMGIQPKFMPMPMPVVPPAHVSKSVVGIKPIVLPVPQTPAHEASADIPAAPALNGLDIPPVVPRVLPRAKPVVVPAVLPVPLHPAVIGPQVQANERAHSGAANDFEHMLQNHVAKMGQAQAAQYIADDVEGDDDDRVAELPVPERNKNAIPKFDIHQADEAQKPAPAGAALTNLVNNIKIPKK
jgi:hypothetical protein